MKILIVISGGTLESVFADTPEVDVELFDVDNERFTHPTRDAVDAALEAKSRLLYPVYWPMQCTPQDRASARRLADVFADRALSMFVHSKQLPKAQRKGVLREYDRLSEAARLLDKIAKETAE